MGVEVRCPVCGEALGMYSEVFTIDKGDRVAGCGHCLHPRNAFEWFAVQRDLCEAAGRKRAEPEVLCGVGLQSV